MAAFGAVQSRWALLARAGRAADRAAVRDAVVAYGASPGQRHLFAMLFRFGDHPAVPVLRHVLPGRPAAGGAAAVAYARRCGTASAVPDARLGTATGRRVLVHVGYLRALGASAGCLAGRSYRRRLRGLTRPTPSSATLAARAAPLRRAPVAWRLVERNLGLPAPWPVLVVRLLRAAVLPALDRRRRRRARRRRSSAGRPAGRLRRVRGAGDAGHLGDERRVYESTFNFFFKLKYAKLYDAILATPMRPCDIALGEIAWALLRGTLYSAAFLVVMLVIGPGHVVVGAVRAAGGAC